MPVSVLEPSDISTSASDFQADGTADAGSTGRVADAAHVHPAGANSALGYQIVTEVVSFTSLAPAINATVSAPAGCNVVGGGFSATSPEGNTNLFLNALVNAPVPDGSGWTVTGAVNQEINGTVTVYAICVTA